MSDEGDLLTADGYSRAAVKRAERNPLVLAFGVLCFGISLVVGITFLLSSYLQRPQQDASTSAVVTATHDTDVLRWEQDGFDFSLLHRGQGILRGRAFQATAIAASDDVPCTTLSIPPGDGSLRVSIATSGFWYGGPSMSRAFWPSNLNSITQQPWRSNDMLADRDSLGSVLELTWLTSTGALLRGLPGSGSFDFSFNEPCRDDGGGDGDEAAATRPSEGQLCLRPTGAAPVLVELCAHADVRAAADGLLARLPRPTEPQTPSLDLLRAPVWSTWARFKMDVDQPKVEAYAYEIAARAFPRSHLEIDDRWSTKYGDLAFDPVKFPDAGGMVGRLHNLGFTVTLWVVPFAERGSDAFAEGSAAGHWLKAADGTPLVITWWQGEGVALNVSDEGALAWFEQRLRSLQHLTGVDGFKFDAGEAMFVPDGVMDDANAFCGRWTRFAARFGGGSEVRCAHQSQDAGLWTREFDKDSRWGLQNGLRALLTAALQLGVLGYPFVLPDMVGGNAYSEEMISSSDAGVPLEALADADVGTAAAGTGAAPADEPARHTFADGEAAANGTVRPASSMFYGSLPPRELYVRWCFANALLPAMQFSIAPWQYDEAASEACRRALELRTAHLPQLEALAHTAARTGEPIVRPLWWHNPDDPTCQWIADEFLLGNTTLVAPVLDAGAHSRPIYLPAGRWLARSQHVYSGPRWLVDHRVALDELATFERLG